MSNKSTCLCDRVQSAHPAIVWYFSVSLCLSLSLSFSLSLFLSLLLSLPIPYLSPSLSHSLSLSLPPPSLSLSPLSGLDFFGGCCVLLFAVNFCLLHSSSSPWIFISLLTPLNANSSFPGLLFISVAWWFDHAGNTRLAIASPLNSPQGHLFLKCYCLCLLTLHCLHVFQWLCFQDASPSFRCTSTSDLFFSSFLSFLNNHFFPKRSPTS